MPNRCHESGQELSVLRREITELVVRNAAVMVQNTIDAVNEGGQYQGIKYLFEMIGLYPASGSEDETEEASLAGVLLNHLGVQELSDSEGDLRRRNERPPIDPLQ